MDPAMLAGTVTSVLAPYLAKAGGAILEHVVSGTPDATAKLWETITEHFESKPAAAAVAADLVTNASDADKQEAFAQQLKMALKNDPDFANVVQELSKQASGTVDNSTHIDVKTGDVSGSSFIIGNNNTMNRG